MKNQVERSKSCKMTRKSGRIMIWVAAAVIAVVMGSAVWLCIKIGIVKSSLESAVHTAQKLQHGIMNGGSNDWQQLVTELQTHTQEARGATDDPVWLAAEFVPWLGPNLSASAQIARTADDVATLAVLPLAEASQIGNWEQVFSEGQVNITLIQQAAPALASASHAVQISAERLESIDESILIPEISAPLQHVKERLATAATALNTTASITELLPGMAGDEGARSYLLLIQNNAELRATGGIPSALAVINFNSGTLSMGTQTTANALGRMATRIPVSKEQEVIYSPRLGTFMQDVNLTPDFPSAAKTAREMWETKTGQRVHGVISVDPMALSYILRATGPIALSGEGMGPISVQGMPTELTEKNIVRTLLSDVYTTIEQPELQDLYFANVAREVFDGLASKAVDAKGLLAGVTKSVAEGRILIWSALDNEQSVLERYPVAGSISGPSVSPAELGVYFNDGTGAKMDYYVKRTVQLIRGCPRGGYEQTTVRITSTNTAPADAATSLPTYVTGGGNYGVPPGSVETNIVAYGPARALVEMAKLDGQQIGFAPYLHSNRPVGVLAIRLAPGESRTVDFIFGKIVQDTELNVVVTPSAQDLADVSLPTEMSVCN